MPNHWAVHLRKIVQKYCFFFKYTNFLTKKCKKIDFSYCTYQNKVVLLHTIMHQTTPAIVLSFQRHGEHGHILHAYTRASGRVNYMVYGAGSKRKSQGQFLPLSLVELTADIRPQRDCPTLSESRLIYLPTQLAGDMRRQAVALFIAEVLYRTLRHPLPDEELFDMLVSVLHEVNEAADIENVHIRFMIRFAARLGWAIDETEFPELLLIPTTRTQRNEQLDALCTYFQTHLDDWQLPKSIDVLREVFI